MKIYISKYRSHWLSPYTILEKVCFWEKDKDAFYNLEGHPNHKYEKWVNRLEPISIAIQKFLDFVHPRIEYIKIDKYDVWNMDSTLSPIILPMLKQLKKDKHGSGVVDCEDVPEHLRYNTTEEWEDQKCFEFYHEHEVKEGDRDIHARWDWVLDEMIWAFCFDTDECEERHSSGEIHFETEKTDGNLPSLKFGPNHTFEVNRDAIHIEMERAANGRRLFAKYYLNLWD